MSNRTYIRFVTDDSDPESRTNQGIFHAISAIRHRDDLEDYIHDWIDEEYGWMNDYLPVPDCFRGSSNAAAICWFRPDAGEVILRTRSLAALLGEHGVQVRMIRSASPGCVIYEDNWQVVAKPRPAYTWCGRRQRARMRRSGCR
ncbi:MAG: hypothetical protein AAGB26_17325 [Planctomycetota bacterium]